MAIDVSPRFTVSLRGYDKDEVERYLESVSERTTQTDEQLYELQEQNRYLEEEHDRLAARVEELEGAIRNETPHTVGALGERITLILNEAEEGASDTLTQARGQAEYLVAEAQKEADGLRRQASIAAAQASETLSGAQRQAEQLAERLEADARSRAATVLGDAELRAEHRREQIEGWARDVISGIEAEQARLTDEFAMIRRRHDAEVRSLLGERDDAIAALRSLQTSLGRAVERMPAGRQTPFGSDETPGVGDALPGDPLSEDCLSEDPLSEDPLSEDASFEPAAVPPASPVVVDPDAPDSATSDTATSDAATPDAATPDAGAAGSGPGESGAGDSGVGQPTMWATPVTGAFEVGIPAVGVNTADGGPAHGTWETDPVAPSPASTPSFGTCSLYDVEDDMSMPSATVDVTAWFAPGHETR